MPHSPKAKAPQPTECPIPEDLQVMGSPTEDASNDHCKIYTVASENAHTFCKKKKKQKKAKKRKQTSHDSGV